MPGEINVISPKYYIDLRIGKAIVRAIIDSGASSKFISEHIARELNLRRHKLHDDQTFKVVNGDTVHCTQFVQVYAQMHTVNFYLSFRVAHMHPDLILGVPFLVRFNPLIDWQARNFRVSRKGCHHWIPIVHKHPAYILNPVAFPHDPSPSSASSGVPFPEWEEYTEEDVKAVAKFYDQQSENPFTPGAPASGSSAHTTTVRKKKKKWTKPEVSLPPKTTQ